MDIAVTPAPVAGDAPFCLDVVDGAGEAQVHLVLPGVEARLAVGRGRVTGTARVTPDDPFGLWALARVGLAWLVEDAGGLLLHASAVLRAGAVVACSGPSGAGKTTMAIELAGDGVPFCEDHLAVWPVGEAWMAAPTPIGVKPERPMRPHGAAPLAAVLFPVQATAHAVHTVGGREAVRRILDFSTWYVGWPARVGRRFAQAVDLVARRPCLEVAFARDPGFWPLVDVALASAGVTMEP